MVRKLDREALGERCDVGKIYSRKIKTNRQIRRGRKEEE